MNKILMIRPNLYDALESWDSSKAVNLKDPFPFHLLLLL